MANEQATDDDGLERQRQELLRLQRLLLPASLPAIGCTQAAAGYRAHNNPLSLGGDWYDLIDRPDDRVVAVIGDVVGHGVEQISVMGQLRAASNAFARTCSSPAEILSMLEQFAAELPDADMTTAQVLMLDGTETIGLASAGHLPPIVVDTDGGITVVETTGRPPLSLFGAGADETFSAGVGDTIVLYTDGVVERPGTVIDEGIRHLAEFVAEHHQKSVSEIVDLTLDHFSPSALDDMALLLLRPVHERSDRYRLQRKQQVGTQIIS
ncbi:MAG: PP2C family protein-serine/threonine phosphatase [Actinomycetota bacterium]